MRYQCANCEHLFRKSTTPLAVAGREDALACPCCDAELRAYPVYSKPWLNHLSWWVLSTVVAMYCVALLLIKWFPGATYAISALELITAIVIWHLYQHFGIIHTRQLPKSRDKKKHP
jgi:hypothetical protein